MELPLKKLIAWLGVGASKFYQWRERYGKANEHNAQVPRDDWLLDEEKQAKRAAKWRTMSSITTRLLTTHWFYVPEKSRFCCFGFGTAPTF
jgi:hypothetical protein